MWFVDETKYKVNIIHAWFNSKHNKKMHAKIVFRNIYTLTHSREKGTTPTTLAILKPWPPQPPEKNEPEQWVVWKNLSETTICKKKLFVKTCKVWKKSSSLFAKNVSWRIKNDLQNCKNLAAKKICKRLIQKDYDYIVHSKYLITYLHQQPPFQEKPCLKDHRYLSDLLSFPHR